MNSLQYIQELFAEMCRQMPGHTPYLIQRGGRTLVFQMRHVFNDWPEWSLDLQDATKSPKELADEMIQQIHGQHD